MKLTSGIVFLAMAAGTALGQNPTVINNTKDTLQAAQKTGSPAKKTGQVNDAAMNASLLK